MKNDNCPQSAERLAIAADVKAVLDTKFFTALCEPVRVDIIRRLITVGAADVKTISMGLSQDRSVVSRHLSTLERAGLTASRKVGRRVEYDLNGPHIVAKVTAILDVIRPMATLCQPFSKDETSSHKKGAA